MSLLTPFPNEIPEETRQIGEAILEANDVCRYLGEHISEILSEEDFRMLYSHTGRSGVHPFILSIVTVLQYLEKLPDRRASQQVVKRIDWKYALHQDLRWQGFHYADLCNFRKRLLAHEASGLVFEKVLKHLAEKGWLKGKGQQRTDATHVVGQVKRLSVFELKWESLRMALVDLISADALWVLKQLPPELTERYATSRNSYRLSEAELKALEQQVERDLLALLKQVAGAEKPEFVHLPYVQLAYRVAHEQVECLDPAEFPDWRDSPLRLDLPDGMIQSPHEPEARYSQKRGQDWTGYKTHMTETVDHAGANFITDMHVTAANVHDSDALVPIQDHLAQRHLSPQAHYVDQGYMSAAHIDHSAERGIDLRGQVQAAASSKTVGFRLCDFHIDVQQQVATCPAGNTSQRWSRVNGTKGVAYRAFFGSQCLTCPFFRSDACTTNPAGRRLDIGLHHSTLQRRRAEQQTTAFRHEMHRRAAIEGTISEAVRSHALRFSRYRGLAKMQLQAYFTGVAINLKRLMAAFFSSLHLFLTLLLYSFFNRITSVVPTEVNSSVGTGLALSVR